MTQDYQHRIKIFYAESSAQKQISSRSPSWQRKFGTILCIVGVLHREHGRRVASSMSSDPRLTEAICREDIGAKLPRL